MKLEFCPVLAHLPKLERGRLESAELQEEGKGRSTEALHCKKMPSRWAYSSWLARFRYFESGISIRGHAPGFGEAMAPGTSSVSNRQQG